MQTSAQTPALPDEPLPARFLNTLWAERGELRDDLATAADVLDWLRGNGFATTAVDAGEAAAVLRLRAALRTAAAHVTAEGTEPGSRPGDVPVGDLQEALGVVNGHADAAPRGRLAAVDDRVRWVVPAPGPTVQDALAALAAAGTALVGGPGAPDLRACHGPRCVRYFVQDHPRREWCSPACGTRARAARHYRRRTGAAAPPG